MQETSIEAFRLVLPKIGKRQLLVLGTLNEPLTDAMISKVVKLPINCITNRRGEIFKKGLIDKISIGKCLVTNNRAIYWKINEKGIKVLNNNLE